MRLTQCSILLTFGLFVTDVGVALLAQQKGPGLWLVDGPAYAVPPPHPEQNLRAAAGCTALR